MEQENKKEDEQSALPQGKEGKMRLIEAIKLRRSIRAFKPDPVPKEVLTQLLDVARWTPSSANTQPWEFFVLTGGVLDKYNHFLIEKVRSGEIWKPRPDPDTDMFTIHPKGLFAKRQQKLFKQVTDLLKPEGGQEQNAEMGGAKCKRLWCSGKDYHRCR